MKIGWVNTKRALILIALGLFVFIVFTFARWLGSTRFFPRFDRAFSKWVLPPRPPEVYDVCQGNLRKIGMALVMYANQNNDRMPESLAELYPDFVSDPKLFVCPADAKMVDLWKNVKDAGDVKKLLSEGRFSYHYIDLGLYTPRETSETLVMFETDFRHFARNPKWMSVLFLDGHVEGVRRERFLEILRNMLTFDDVPPKQKEYLAKIIHELEVSSEK